MNHRVINVDLLYSDSINMYKMIVIGNADVIIKDLALGINNLKENWHGMDAGVQIQTVIRIHNDLIYLRNKLAELAQTSSLIASNYKHLQNLNNEGNEEFIPLRIELSDNLPDHYDYRDTTYMNPNALRGKEALKRAKNSMNSFVSQLNIGYSNIMNNWLAGAGRNLADHVFNDFTTEVKDYITVLGFVCESLERSLRNYTNLG